MKPLFLPEQDDHALLRQVRMDRVHNICVSKNIDAIVAGYRLYRMAVRRPDTIKGLVQVPDDLKKALEAKYTEGRGGKGAFSYIEQRADKPGSVSCPYCGRKGLGTIDHYLPQKHFAVYSVYSPNMVPACHACQSSKLSRHADRSARPIHPLLDRFGIAQAVVIETRIDDSGELAASSFRFSSQPTRPVLRRSVRKREALMLKQHYRFFDLARRDEVKNDCVLELNRLRSRLHEDGIPAGEPARLRTWMTKMLARAESSQDVDSTPFLREGLLRGFLASERAMLRFARAHVPVAEFTRSEKNSMLKKRP